MSKEDPGKIKVLVGGMNLTGDSAVFRELKKVFDAKNLSVKDSDIIFDLEKDTVHDVLLRLKEEENWQPDVIIWWISEYNSVINKIEESPVPTLSIVMDWNITYISLKDTIKRFDCAVTDLKGSIAFQKTGYKNIFYWRFPSFHPDLFKKSEIAYEKRAYDVIFIGHFNHYVHRERSYWLKRLALLGNKYNIKLLTGVYGSDYAHYFQNSKIVFNYSVRGEANLRAFEAPACTTVVFNEEDNNEIHKFFEDGKDCVFYNSENFEKLFDEYLSNTEKLKEIAVNSYNKVQSESYYSHFLYLEKLIKEKVLFQNFQQRLFYSLSPKKQALSEIMALFYVADKPGLNAAVKKANAALESFPDEPEILNALGVAQSLLTHQRDNILKKRLRALNYARKIISRAIELSPKTAIFYFNRANISLNLDDTEEALQDLLTAFRLLKSDTPDLSGSNFFYPRHFDLFLVEWEKASSEFQNNKELLNENLSAILLWKVCELLGDLYFKENNFSESNTWYKSSLDSVNFSSGETRRKYALTLSLTGNEEEAVSEYKKAYDEEPFNTLIWQQLISLLIENNKKEEVLFYSNEIATVIKAVPLYHSFLDWLEPKLTELSL